MVNSILASSSFTPRGTSNGKISTAVKECPQKVPNGLSWRFYFNKFQLCWKPLSLSQHIWEFTAQRWKASSRGTIGKKSPEPTKAKMASIRRTCFASRGLMRVLPALSLAPSVPWHWCHRQWPTFAEMDMFFQHLNGAKWTQWRT